MAILLDLSQIAISNLMASPNIKKGDVDENLIKHMVINSIRAYKKKFGAEYGQIVICCDASHYWRKDIFPHYKGQRKAGRKKSKFDWGEVFAAINNFKADLKEYFPYKVLEVHGAEGDDIIAIIAKNTNEKTIIIGSDKDYRQLLSNSLVKQYSPTQKEFLEVECPKEFLNALIITGDKDDGIPNIKSDADTFMIESKRQSPIKKAEIASWKKCSKPEEFCENRMMLDNHLRNKELIDFDYIPKDLIKAVLVEYDIPARGSKAKITQYFMDNRMKMLLKDLGDF